MRTLTAQELDDMMTFSLELAAAKDPTLQRAAECILTLVIDVRIRRNADARPKKR